MIKQSSRPSIIIGCPESLVADHPFITLLQAIAAQYPGLCSQTYSAKKNSKKIRVLFSRVKLLKKSLSLLTLL